MDGVVFEGEDALELRVDCLIKSEIECLEGHEGEVESFFFKDSVQLFESDSTFKRAQLFLWFQSLQNERVSYLDLSQERSVQNQSGVGSSRLLESELELVIIAEFENVFDFKEVPRPQGLKFEFYFTFESGSKSGK